MKKMGDLSEEISLGRIRERLLRARTRRRAREQERAGRGAATAARRLRLDRPGAARARERFALARLDPGSGAAASDPHGRAASPLAAPRVRPPPSPVRWWIHHVDAAD
jgi:hypothetical protein